MVIPIKAFLSIPSCLRWLSIPYCHFLLNRSILGPSAIQFTFTWTKLRTSCPHGLSSRQCHSILFLHVHATYNKCILYVDTLQDHFRTNLRTASYVTALEYIRLNIYLNLGLWPRNFIHPHYTYKCINTTHIHIQIHAVQFENLFSHSTHIEIEIENLQTVSL